MSDNYAGTATNDELVRNLGTGQPESRSASFGAGVLATHPGAVHASAGLTAAAQRYDAHVARHFVEAGVEQMTQNLASGLSMGVSDQSDRTGTWQGHRFLLSSPNARSEQTSTAQPILEEDR